MSSHTLKLSQVNPKKSIYTTDKEVETIYNLLLTMSQTLPKQRKKGTILKQINNNKGFINL